MAGVRTLAVLAGFIVLASLWPDRVSRLPLHLFLALGGAWALRIGARAGGTAFGRSDSPTKFLAVPMVIGVALSLLDLWELLVAP